jgi:DNA-binding NarL/FixJ family response regulator
MGGEVERRGRVLIADDTMVVRRGLAEVVSRAGHEVVAETVDLPSTLQEVHRLRPDAVLVDIRMPPSHTLEGLEIARSVRANYSDTAVLVLSQHVIDSYARRLLDDSPGSVGYLLKDSLDHPSQLLEALDRVMDGGTVVDPLLIEHLVSARIDEGESLRELTETELAVLELLAEGLTNKGIARRRMVGLATVDSQVRAIFQKLGLDPDPDVNRRVRAVLAFLSAQDRRAA